MARKKIPENYEKMKQTIIQAAIEVIVGKSMTEFCLTDVAEAVGLTKAAIYWYFPNKNVLLEEVAQSVYHTYIGYVRRIGESDLSPYEKLKRVILGEADTVQSAKICVFPVKLYLEAFGKDSGIRTLIQEGYEEYNKFISTLIVQGIRCGEFRSDLPAAELARVITGAIDGLAFQNLLISPENIVVPRKIIFSVIDSVLCS